MKLFFRDMGGEGRPIIILHGVLGSSKNWITAGKNLSVSGHVFALDQRNHGDSPHSDSHTLDDLVGDLDEWISDHSARLPVLVGHSMGGLVAMAFALRYPDKISGILVVDIAPKAYRETNRDEFAAISVDVSQAKNRSEIDAKMKAFVPDATVRQFLQMNLESLNSGGYRWKIPVEVLKKADFSDGMDSLLLMRSYSGPALFILGGKSPYVSGEDFPAIKKFFPSAKIEVLPDADHWLHFSAAADFQRLAAEFLSRLKT